MTDEQLREIQADIMAIEKQLRSVQAKINEEFSRRRIAARCQWMSNSNFQCQLPTNHQGVQKKPCINRGAHRKHFDLLDDYYVECSGRAYDAT